MKMKNKNSDILIKKISKRIAREAMNSTATHRTYKTTYKDIHKYFKIFNKLLFKGKLIPFNDIKIRKIHSTWAQFTEVFNNRKKTVSYWLEILPEFPNRKEFLISLAHEMIHYSQILNGKQASHNDYFFSFKNKFKKLNLTLN
jgi:predicted NAD/FAD-binding protein